MFLGKWDWECEPHGQRCETGGTSETGETSETGGTSGTGGTNEGNCGMRVYVGAN